jgi:hypothetical protein
MKGLIIGGLFLVAGLVVYKMLPRKPKAYVVYVPIRDDSVHVRVANASYG